MEAQISGSTAAVSGRVVEPSVSNALPHFSPLAIFPATALAAMYGGWWFMGPFAFFVLAGAFERLFGLEERNMDPATTSESQLFPYKLSVWLWGVSWPVVFIFSLWQILVSGHLALWEIGFLIPFLAFVAQSVFIVGHELVHRRVRWERRLGEFLLASASYPHYATEHPYIHHPHVCTPLDHGSAPKGMSFWAYILPELKHNLLGAWRFELRGLERRQQPLWHYTNAFWRYAAGIAFWYGLIFWMGGLLAVLIYVAVCGGVVFSMKVSNYVQHYGLRRVRTPSGRFEPVKPRHAWSAAYKFTDWMYYNMQRHADHHTQSGRYPLLQHHDESASPQLPGSYTQMDGLALFPKRWFETIDPLLDRQRAQFYPEIDDWSAYDSRAFAARPAAFDAIAEIHAASPRLAAWINRSPRLLDRLREREFTDLELPAGIGPDPEFERVARSGLARLYWTRELDLSEMKAQLAEIPVQDAGEAVDAAREWSNGKVFQVAMHVMRGSLSIAEAGTALSRVVEASIASVLAAAEEDGADRGLRSASGGVAVVLMGSVTSAETMPGETLDVRFVYEGSPAKHHQTLCRRFRKALRALSSDNLLLAPIPRGAMGEGRTLAEFEEQLQCPGSGRELGARARARCVLVSGDEELGERVGQALRDALDASASRELLAAELRESGNGAEPGLLSIVEMRGGLRDIDRAALYLQMAPGVQALKVLERDAGSAFRNASERGLIAEDAAERLAAAAALWLNLHGLMRFIPEDGFAPETAAPGVKAVIAEACGLDDFDALVAAVRDTGSRAAADLDELARVTAR